MACYIGIFNQTRHEHTKKKGHKDGQQKSHRPHARLTTLNIRRKRKTEGNYK